MSNWTIDTDAQGYCWLALDRENSSANTLGHEVLTELDTILDKLNKDMPKGLVIKSAKKNGFIAGADISEFVDIQSEEDAFELVRNAQLIFDKIESLSCPTVAMINGFCLGGGLELALACKYRVALDSPKTKIGLPEVLLGVQPGWGGSVRLPRLIGSLNALNLILPGKLLGAYQAYKMGIVDAAVPERHFQAAVEYYLTKSPTVRTCGASEKIIQANPMRKAAGKYLKRELRKRVNDQHYPAPYTIVDTWVKNSIFAKDAYIAEARSIARLMVTPTARNLVKLFFLRDRLKGLAKDTKFSPKHIHVIGAGVMGGDIAAWCALSGFNVTVQDQSIAAIAATLSRAQTLFERKFKLPFLVQSAKDRLTPDPKGLGIAKADVIIEAIVEKPEAKQTLFAELEQKAQAHCILASNTSTIPLATIGQNLKDPSRVVGIHFFNPVPLMQLVEVVSDPHTDKQVVANAMAFVGKIDKLPLPVLSVPGFLVNRILIPYLLESAVIYSEGVSGPAIDKAATDFGMLMGPIELMDTVGLDVCIAAAKGVGTPIPESVEKLVTAGNLGKKTGKGFYNYTKSGKVIKPKLDTTKSTPPDITDRMILCILNEAACALREGVVADADLVDAGLVFGAGFAPFRGGPMVYAAAQGKEDIKQRLLALEKAYGERFKPDPYWG